MANPTGNQNKNNQQDPNTPPKQKFSRGLLSWMLICFALIAFYYKSKGGYKPIVLDEEEGNNKHDDPEGEPIPAVEL